MFTLFKPDVKTTVDGILPQTLMQNLSSQFFLYDVIIRFSTLFVFGESLEGSNSGRIFDFLFTKKKPKLWANVWLARRKKF